MSFLRSNTILDFYESSPALRCNLFFACAKSLQKKGFTLRSGLKLQTVCISKPQF